MKRVKAACICQTLHFMLKEDVAHDWAVKQVEQDVEQYKKTLERNRTQHKILEQTTHSGSVWVNDPGELAIQTGTITPKPYAGCIFIGTNTSKQEGDVIPGGTVIVLKYETTVADPEPTALYEGFVKDAPAKPGLHSLGDL